MILIRVLKVFSKLKEKITIYYNDNEYRYVYNLNSSSSYRD